MSVPRTDQAVILRVYELFDAGQSGGAIARALKIPNSTVCRWLQDRERILATFARREQTGAMTTSQRKSVSGISRNRTLYMSGMSKRAEMIIRLVSFKNRTPLHVLGELLAETLIARTWRGSQLVERIVLEYLVNHPEETGRVGKMSVSQLMGAFSQIVPVYSKELAVIDAVINKEAT